MSEEDMMDLDIGAADLESDMDDLPAEPGDEDDNRGEEDDEESTTAAAAAGRASAKKKAQAKSRVKIVDGKGKQRKKTVGGKKWCPPCGVWEPLENFPKGSGQCAEGRQIMQNLKNAALAQNEEEWWAATTSDPEKLKKAVANYKARCPQVKGKKRPTFQILRYKEEVRQEEAVLFDGIYEMMSCKHYIYWMGKAKNGSMDPEEAKAQWLQKYNAPKAITDSLGLNPKDKDRVAIKKTDLITFRNGQIKSHGYELASKDTKNAKQEDIDKAERMMQDGFQSTSAAAMDRMSMASAIASANAAASFGDGGGAFGVDGRNAMNVPKIKELLSDDEDANDKEEEGDDADASGVDETPKKDGAASEVGSTKKLKKPQAWFDRDSVISGALRSHQTWLKNTKRDLEGQVKHITDIMHTITPEMQENVKNEKRLCQNRIYALKLVLGNATSSDEPEALEAAAKAATSASAAPPAQDAGAGPPGPEAPAPEVQKKDEQAGAGAGEAAPADAAGAPAAPAAKAEATAEAAAAEAAAAAGAGSTPAAAAAAEAAAGEASGADKASTVGEFVRSSGGDPKKALRRYIASFSAGGTNALGSAPPCRSYRSLICYVEFQDYLNKMEICDTREALTALTVSMKPFKAAYADVLSMAKAAGTRLSNAVADAKKDLEQDTTKEPPKKRGRPAKKGVNSAMLGPLVENPQTVCTEIASIVITDEMKPATPFDKPDMPTIFRLSQTTVDNIPGLKDQLDALQRRFSADPLRADPGRLQRKLSDETSKAVADIISKIFPEDFFIDEGKITDAVKQAKDLVLTSFAIAKGRTTCSAEAGHLAVVRMGYKGQRQLVCTPTLNLLEYVSSVTKQKSKPKQANHWFKTMTVELAKTYRDAHQENKLLYATVGPLDMLYIPPGWTFYEKINNNDFIGVRSVHLTPSHLELLDKISKYLISCDSANTSLQRAVDCLAIAET